MSPSELVLQLKAAPHILTMEPRLHRQIKLEANIYAHVGRMFDRKRSRAVDKSQLRCSSW